MKPSGKTSSQPSAKQKVRLNTILVPIDFSPASLDPIQWAKFITQRSNASIHLVSVHDLRYPLATSLTPSAVESEAEMKDHLHRDLQTVALSQGVRNADFHVRAGRPFAQICQLAGEMNADLIALSTRGRTGWERALLGSTTERVIRYAPCPVLVVRPRRARRERELKLQKIIVPVDFSDCSARGLKYAIGLAQLFGAELALLHVIELRHDLPSMIVYSHSELRRRAREIAETCMADLLRRTDFGGVKFTATVKTGSAAQKVCRYALTIGADLILTSTHGRTGLPHMLIGSTAEQIVRYAKSTVLIVPTRDKKNA